MKNEKLWVLLTAISLIAGCAIGYTRITKAPEVPLRNYKVVQIPDLTGSDQVPDETKKGIPDKIAEGLGKEKLFAGVQRGTGGKDDSIVILNGRVVQYNPGSRGMRYLTGPLWGVGKGTVIVNVKLVEKSSGRELADSNFEGEIKGGFFGGGIDETHEIIADEIIQFIKSNY